MSERDMTIPTADSTKVEAPVEQENKAITQEEAVQIERVFFEDDEKIKLRDGRVYNIPPLGLKDAKRLMAMMNTINTTIILENLIEDEEGGDNYQNLMEVLLMAFKPYYPKMTVEYLENYVDLLIAKKIIDAMIGLNGLKKLL